MTSEHCVCHAHSRWQLWFVFDAFVRTAGDIPSILMQLKIYCVHFASGNSVLYSTTWIIYVMCDYRQRWEGWYMEIIATFFFAETRYRPSALGNGWNAITMKTMACDIMRIMLLGAKLKLSGVNETSFNDSQLEHIISGSPTHKC